MKGLLRVIKTVDTAKLSQRLLDNMREEIQVQLDGGSKVMVKDAVFLVHSRKKPWMMKNDPCTSWVNYNLITYIYI